MHGGDWEMVGRTPTETLPFSQLQMSDWQSDVGTPACIAN